MGFLDKVKTTAQQVGEKAQEGLKAGQDKIDDVRLKKRIDDLKEELGGIVFLQRTGKAPDNAEAEITRIVGEIEEAEQQLANGASGDEAGEAAPTA